MFQNFRLLESHLLYGPKEMGGLKTFTLTLQTEQSRHNGLEEQRGLQSGGRGRCRIATFVWYTHNVPTDYTVLALLRFNPFQHFLPLFGQCLLHGRKQIVIRNDDKCSN